MSHDVIQETSSVHTASSQGMTTSLVRVECGYGRGFSGLQLLGNTSEICKDGKERAKTALENIGFTIPTRKIIVSFTPGDLKKDGTHLDLPLAVCLAALTGQKSPHTDIKDWLFAAELSLDGSLIPVRGAIGFTIAAASHRLKGVVLAADNLNDVSPLMESKTTALNGLRILGFRHLSELFDWMLNQRLPNQKQPIYSPQPDHQENPTFDDMVLTDDQKALACTVAAGRHSLLLRGTPGSGKSMFASRLPSILPKMTESTHLESLEIHSTFVAKIPRSLVEATPPFRSPHHSASSSAILGTPSAPGELSLSHGGILFLDELPEFRRDLLESLREPLETGEVSVSRAQAKLTWKSKAILIAACNNCPCGWFGSDKKTCRCPISKIQSYQQKLSGPLLDRIDIHSNVTEPEQSSSLFHQLSRTANSSQTDQLSRRVRAARTQAVNRNKRYGHECNSELKAKDLQSASGLSEDRFLKLIQKVCSKKLSRRSIVKTVRVARTLADLDGEKEISETHLNRAYKWQAESAADQRGDFAYGI